MSEAHVAELLRSIPRLRPGRVVLSGGGEPLLHPAARRLLEELQRAAVPVTILTNGAGGLAPEELADLGVERLLVNLSAGTPEGYARVHPWHADLWGVVLERLRRLRRRGSPAVTLLAVIQRENRREIPALVERASELGADRLALKGMEPAPGLEPLALDGCETAEVRVALEPARQRARALGVELDAAHLESLLGSEERAPDRCFMGWYTLRVTCAGEAMFCCKDRPVGHLDRASLYEIWRSPSYHLARLRARDAEPGGPLDDRCRACSNFVRNAEIAARLTAGAR